MSGAAATDLAVAPDPAADLVVGVISDTHDHLYPEVKQLLEGVDHILHAGDVCSPGVLAELRQIAPVRAVRGNCDAGAWAESLPGRDEFGLGAARIAMIHMGGRLRELVAHNDPSSAAWDVIVFGHSHQALVELKNGVLVLNPGSAGPRRYGRPRTMAFLRISATGQVSADIVVIEG